MTICGSISNELSSRAAFYMLSVCVFCSGDEEALEVKRGYYFVALLISSGSSVPQVWPSLRVNAVKT